MSERCQDACSETDALLASLSDAQLLHFTSHVKDEVFKRFPLFKAVGEAMREAPADGALGDAIAGALAEAERVITGNAVQ